MTISVPQGSPETTCGCVSRNYLPDVARGMEELLLELRGHACICGALQGEDFDPAGVVNVEDGRVTLGYVPRTLTPSEAHELGGALVQTSAAIEDRPAVFLLVPDAVQVAQRLGVDVGALLGALGYDNAEDAS